MAEIEMTVPLQVELGRVQWEFHLAGVHFGEDWGSGRSALEISVSELNGKRRTTG